MKSDRQVAADTASVLADEIASRGSLDRDPYVLEWWLRRVSRLLRTRKKKGAKHDIL